MEHEKKHILFLYKTYEQFENNFFLIGMFVTAYSIVSSFSSINIVEYMEAKKAKFNEC